MYNFCVWFDQTNSVHVTHHPHDELSLVTPVMGRWWCPDYQTVTVSYCVGATWWLGKNILETLEGVKLI